MWEGEKKSIVVSYSESICLRDCRFIVQPSGRKRVLDEKTKNVHAFVEGIVIRSLNLFDPIEITYNPYLFDSFIIKGTNEKIKSIGFVNLINGSKIFGSEGVKRSKI